MRYCRLLRLRFAQERGQSGAPYRNELKTPCSKRLVSRLVRIQRLLKVGH
jgi:hypothetical protein